ncbi:MAG: nucleotidyltransferase domain-containing protein [Kiritimatiellales bacterium]
MDLEQIKLKVTPICRRYFVRQMDLFGSRARGDAGGKSDFDFCVRFNELSPAEYSRNYFGLLHELEDSFESPVDLLPAESVTRTSLKKNLHSEGIRVYG